MVYISAAMRPEKRAKPSMLQRFLSSPLQALAQILYRLRSIKSRHQPQPIRVVCISDTHNLQPKIPDGDVLIHAGNLTQAGNLEELEETIKWLNSLPHTHKLVVGGEHDYLLQFRNRYPIDWGNIIYLQDEHRKTDFPNGRSLHFYGTSLVKNPAGLHPLNGTHTEITAKEIDVLITHPPPLYHLDVDGYGSKFILDELWRIRPTLHVFGQIHGGYGTDVLTYDEFEATYERIRRGPTYSYERDDQDIWAYSWVRRGSRPWRGLTEMFFGVVKYWLSSDKGKARGLQTTLVNAAHVGGVRDDLRRPAVVIDI